MADCNETLRELEAFLDGELSDEAQAVHPRVTSTAAWTACRRSTSTPNCARSSRQKCSNDEMPPGLLAKIEACFGEDFDGDGRIG